MAANGLSFNATHRTSMGKPSEMSKQGSVEWAVVQAVAYGDVFDYPLHREEVKRYVVGAPCAGESIGGLFLNSPRLSNYLTPVEEYLTLAGRESLVATRRRRARTAEAMWHKALRYGRAIASLPFVRMVAVTGALAVDNVEPEADIDYLVVTEPGRLWLCRAIVIGLVRVAAKQGDIICPNYFLSEHALVIEERNLFTAHELTQMVPIGGRAIYERMRQLNSWTAEFLPNAAGPARELGAATAGRSRWQSLAERGLRTAPGSWIERWEMDRKVRKLNRGADHPEAGFSPDWCKGHFEGHGQRILDAYAQRLQVLAAVAEEIAV